MERNFGTRQRDPLRAAKSLLQHSRTRGGVSFSTVATVHGRFKKFVEFIRDRGITRLEKVSRTDVQLYAAFLKTTNYEPSYQQNLLSAVNTVFDLGYANQNRRWEPVTARAEGLTARDNVRRTSTTSREQLAEAQLSMCCYSSAVAGLARELGLRIKEASLLNATVALIEAEKSFKVSIVDGTKGGRPRSIPVTNESQFKALAIAAQVQSGRRSVMPENMTWITFVSTVLYNGRSALKDSGITGYHALRAAYACDRYFEETGHLAPCNASGRRTAEKELDAQARLIIAEELGHGRVSVLVSYVGSSRG